MQSVRSRRGGDVIEHQGPLTPIAKYRVNAMDPKYTAVKGRRGVETRCFPYVTGPRRTAHDVRKNKDPMDQLKFKRQPSATTSTYALFRNESAS